MNSDCTIIKPLRRCRTSPVRMTCRYLCAALATFLGSMPTVVAEAEERVSVGKQQRLEAEGWLQLKKDQESYRECVEPLPPKDAATLEHLDHRQQGELRDLQLRQRQSLQTERRRQRRPNLERPVARGPELKNQRQMERQRLDMRIQRETLGSGHP
ncbi:MAG: hypothetical protein U9Q81_06020 [Pseudomonadota bacterium]|nr:hypothetical protein [Pseudomonadota bacterium]